RTIMVASPSVNTAAFSFYCSGAHPYLHSFPTRRSSDLICGGCGSCGMCGNDEVVRLRSPDGRLEAVLFQRDCGATTGNLSRTTSDRKSTRLNSSHDQISYAVFCLKKKKKTTQAAAWRQH